MPVIDRAIAFLRGQKSVPILNDNNGNLPTIRVVGGSGLPGAQWTARGYQQMAQAGYKDNSDVYACISLIAAAGKQVKWWDGGGNSKAHSPLEKLARAVGSDPYRDIASVVGDKAAIARRIKAATDPRASIAMLKGAGGAEFIEAWLSYILISGNDYIEIDRRANNDPVMVYLMRPDRVTAAVRPASDNTAPHMTEVELVESWRISTYGRARPVVPANIVHSKLFNPLDDIYGMAPLEAAMLKIDAQNEGIALLKRILQRGFSPGWIEAAKDSIWEEPQVAQLKERLGRSKAAGEEIFLENATWHQMGFNPSDSGVGEQQILSKRDIASVFHVPAQLIGDTTTQTYNTYGEARRALYMEAVIPLLTQFRDDWNATLGRELNSPLDFDKDSFDAIAAARSEACDRVHKLFTAGIITQNEARGDLEYGAVAGGDVFYAPANMMPLGEADVTGKPAGQD